MRSTKRLLERRARESGVRRCLFALVSVACAASATGSVLTACSSDDEQRAWHAPPIDAGSEETPITSAPSADDGGIHVEHPDAEPFDGGPLPVVCEGSPCVKALVTTLGPSITNLGEGFCALLDDGTVACWGANAGGQLGRGVDAGVLDDPTAARVEGLANVIKLDHTCALDASGAVWCWGTGPHLRDGLASVTTDKAPVRLALDPATAIAVGSEVGCAATSAGLVCWGKNTNGQLAPLSSTDEMDASAATPVALPSGPAIRDLVVSNASFVVRNDGIVLSWGANPPLGRVSSLFPDPNPTPLALRGVSSLDSSYASACATASGIGYCWGDIQVKPWEGVNPNVPHVDRALPEPVTAPEPLVRIATTRSITTGNYQYVRTTPQRWCGVAASGAVYCWGYNQSGQAGDGTKVDALVDAVRVHGLPGPVADVKTTPNATCALLTSGKVYCWGSNYYGQLGNGLLKVPSLTPQEVALP